MSKVTLICEHVALSKGEYGEGMTMVAAQIHPSQMVSTRVIYEEALGVTTYDHLGMIVYETKNYLLQVGQDCVEYVAHYDEDIVLEAIDNGQSS